MRLLYITPYAPSPIRVRPYELLRSLCAERLRPTVLCPATAADAASLDQLRAWGIDVIAVPVTSAQRAVALVKGALAGLPLQAAYGVTGALRHHLRRRLATERFDLVQIEHLRAAALLPLIRPLPVVYDAVDCISLLLERTRRDGPDRRSRWIAALELGRTRAFERMISTRASLTTVTSAAEAAALQQLAPDATIRIVPNGVDTVRFAPPTGAREPQTVVFSGKMSYHANVAAAQRLVERIMPLVWATLPSARLVIVGSAPPPALRRYIADPRITVTGYVPEIAPYLQRATVAATPLCYGVGVQNKVLEALATATPTVADPQAVAALRAQPGRDLLVAPDDPSFAAQLIELLTDAELCARIGAAGRRYVEDTHRWSASARLLLDAYEQVVLARGAAIPPSMVGLRAVLTEQRRQA